MKTDRICLEREREIVRPGVDGEAGEEEEERLALEAAFLDSLVNWGTLSIWFNSFIFCFFFPGAFFFVIGVNRGRVCVLRNEEKVYMERNPREKGGYRLI